MEKIKHPTNLPHGGYPQLVSAIDRGLQARGEDFSPEGWRRFETTFARSIADLVRVHGLGATLRALIRHEERIELPCGLSFLGDQGMYLPDSIDAVEEAVEEAVLSSFPVENYIVYGRGLKEPCWISVTDEVYALIPRWEAWEIILRLRDKIEERKLQLEDQLREQGY